MKQIFARVSIESFRRQLASVDSTPQFALLGICSGLVTGLVIIVFRKMVEMPLSIMLPENSENFEGLSLPYYFIMPFVGGLILALFMSLIRPDHRPVGVTHVLQRLGRYQGHLPVGNLLTQLFAGTIGLVSGQSGGREGPAIHLGAAGSSLLGQYLNLPNNSIRILVGCGAAAAIAGSFNTPIAGVIFSMEVIILEYTIAGFVPVILAAVVAAFLNQLVFGADIAFGVPPVAMLSFYDLPFLILEGIFIGSVAALFVKTIQVIHDAAPKSLPLKLMIAATVTGLAALLMPQVLGIGYDTVNSTLLGEIPLLILLAVCFLKLLTSATSVALGMPVGLIGPTIFIGALAGGILAAFAHYLTDGLSSPAFYVMLGMGAMMGAALQAPLAALMAVVEMTHNPNIILPAMLVIVVANIVASELYGQKSIFITQMEMLGLDFRQNPLSMALNRASVASIMSRSFLRVSQLLDAERINEINTARPQWLLVDGDQGPDTILRTEDLVTYLDVNSIDVGDDNISPINLNAIPATRKDVTSILLQATLSEALDTINNTGVGALYVNRISAPLIDSPVGIVTKEDIESYYQL